MGDHPDDMWGTRDVPHRRGGGRLEGRRAGDESVAVEGHDEGRWR